jgi:hypothetical protein
MWEQQGRERKVNRSIGSGCGYGYGYDGQMSDPQGMPLTGIAPWSQRPLRSLVKTDERLLSRTRSGGEVRLRSFYLSEAAAITGVPGGVEGCADANRNNTARAGTTRDTNPKSATFKS